MTPAERKHLCVLLQALASLLPVTYGPRPVRQRYTPQDLQAAVDWLNEQCAELPATELGAPAGAHYVVREGILEIDADRKVDRRRRAYRK